MADQTQRLEIATVRAEVGSNIVFRFANDAANADSIPTQSGDIQNLKQVVLEIQQDAAEKISISTTIYPTVAAGLAATADQGIFLVQSNDADEIYTVWQNQAGTAVNTGKTALSATAIQTALDASNQAAQAAEQAADNATARTAGFLASAALAPATRDNGLPLQQGDRYFNTAEQAEYIYTAGGWEANESQQEIAAFKLDMANESDPTKGAALSGYDGGTVADVLNNTKPIFDYTALRNYTGQAKIVNITKPGIYGYFRSIGIVGGYSDNGFTVIVANNGAVWVRIFSGPANLAWTGCDMTGVLDASTALAVASDYCKANSVKLFGHGKLKLSANCSVRYLDLDFSGLDIVIDAGFSLTVGGYAGNFRNNDQKLGVVRRSTYNFDPSTFITPTVICIGAKGMKLTSGFIEYLQFFQSTNPSTFPHDASQAYSFFDLLFTMRIEVTTDPAYDGGPSIDGPGSANQWFNENQFRLGRCIWFEMKGSYLHNNNLIVGGTFEATGSRINISSGNKNRFDHVRAEGNNLTVSFGPNSIGNSIECDWFSSVPNAFTVPIINDLGTLNTVRTAVDRRYKFIDVLHITPNDLVFDTSVGLFANRDPNLAFIRGSASFATMGVSDKFEVSPGDYIYPTASAFTYTQQGVYNIKLYFYDKKGNPVTPSTTFTLGSATPAVQGMSLQSRFSTANTAIAVTSAPAWIAIQPAAFAAGVAMARVEVICTNTLSEGIATDILVTRMTSEQNCSLPRSGNKLKLPVVSAVPKKGWAEIGTVAMSSDGAQEFRVRLAIDTFSTAAASLGATEIVVSEITRSGVGTVVAGTIVGISDDANNTEWTTVASVNVGAKTITLSDPLKASLSVNSRVVFIGWRTV